MEKGQELCQCVIVTAEISPVYQKNRFFSTLVVRILHKKKNLKDLIELNLKTSPLSPSGVNPFRVNPSSFPMDPAENGEGEQRGRGKRRVVVFFLVK
jgi:hypothetical protein